MPSLRLARRATPDFVIDTGRTDSGFLSPDKFQVGFAHDAEDPEAAFLRDAQVPINMSVFATALDHAAWRTKPSWAVIATEDRAFDGAMLRHRARSGSGPPSLRSRRATPST